jgi:hypothetical protein
MKIIIEIDPKELVELSILKKNNIEINTPKFKVEDVDKIFSLIEKRIINAIDIGVGK